MNALDELCPSFSERGTPFGGQLRLRVGFGVLLAGERLQREVFPFSIGARSRGIGSHVMSAVFPRLWNLCEDSGQELKDIEGLALRMRGKGVVIRCAFRFVEKRLCAPCPVNARQAEGAAK